MSFVYDLDTDQSRIPDPTASWTMEQRFTEQLRQEAEVNAFVDRNFLPRLGCCWERTTDRRQQNAGIDIVLHDCSDPSQKRVTIDEKVKMSRDWQGRPYLNRLVPNIAFEALKKGRYGYYEGWFTWSGIKTMGYALESVFASVSTPEEVLEENITKVVYLYVHKSAIYKAIGLTKEEVAERARQYLKDHGRSFPEVEGAYWSHSTKWEESPVNLVLPRTFLASLPGSREITIRPQVAA